MNRPLAIACLFAAACCVWAEGSDDLPPGSRSGPSCEFVDRIPERSEPGRATLSDVDRLPEPKDVAPVLPLPAVPGPILPPRGPLYLDLQTMQSPAGGVEAILAAPPCTSPADPLCYHFNSDSAFQVGGLIRGYLRDDQRIEFSGLETSFGAEGVLRPLFVSRTDDCVVAAQGEFFLNMRYGPTILSDPQRDQYRGNFQIDTFQIFQLFLEATWDDLTVRLGRSRTPFGRYQSPMFTNSMQDAQFLRTEVINFVETGLFLRYRPNEWVFDLAATNGEPDLDTNSGKALVGRVGYETSWWTAGGSFKYQDGVGSEWQKRYNNQFGLDASVALGRWLVYGEAVYDQHGFRRNPWMAAALVNPLFAAPRSLYGRDAFSGTNGKAIGGAGAYLGVTYRADDWLVDLSYGNYQPAAIGIPFHDAQTNRLLVKTAYAVARNLEAYLVVLCENRRPVVPPLSSAPPLAVWAGMQYGF